MSQIEEIKNKLNIVDVVGKSVPDLKRAGRNYKACCPFHQEKTPSFMVNPDLGRFKCFGCGESGDVISFIEKTERVDFREALQMAADMAGVKLKDNGPKKDPAKEARIKKLKEANKLAAKYYNYLLTKHTAGKPALNYSISRGFDETVIDKFILGYAPNGDNLVKYLGKKGYSTKELVDFGLASIVRGKVLDKFRDRLMFTIRNLRGEVIGFSGRTLQRDGIPKYLNTPETDIYRKSEAPYGIYIAKDSIRKQNFAILFEGNVDIVNSHRLGIENVVCPLGTALTMDQLKIINRYAETVYFCFDTDSAGYKALLKGIELAEAMGIKHKVVNIQGYHDADDLMMKAPQEWQKKVDSAGNSIEYVFQLLQGQYDLGGADGKIAFRDEALKVLSLVRDQVVINHFLDKLSSLLGVGPDVLNQDLSKPSKKRTSPPIVSQKEETEKKSLPISRREKLILAYLIQLTDWENIHVSADIFRNAEARELFEAMEASKDKDLGKISETVSEAAGELLEQTLLESLPTVDSIEEEVRKTYYQLYIHRLRRRIKELGSDLENLPDNTEILSKFNGLTKTLKEVSSNKNGWPVIVKDVASV